MFVCLSVCLPVCILRMQVSLMRARFGRNFVALSSFVVVAAVSIYVMRHTQTQLLLQMSAVLSVPYPFPVPVLSSLFLFSFACLPFAYETRHVCFESVRSSSAHTYYVVCIHEATSVTTQTQTVHKPNPVAAAMRRAVRKLNTPSRMLVKFPFGMLLSLRFTRSFPPTSAFVCCSC